MDPNTAALNDALNSGQVTKWRQMNLWSRIQVAAGAIAGTKQTFFTTTRQAAPSFTNAYTANGMGPNEQFTVQGISISLNPLCTTAGLLKYLPEAVFFFGLGTDNIEKLRAPVTFLPSPVGWLTTTTAGPDSRLTTPYGFWRLEQSNQIEIKAGMPFEASISIGSAAAALGAGETIDLYCILHGAYLGQVAS